VEIYIEGERRKEVFRMRIDKKKLFTLFLSLTLLIVSLMSVNLKVSLGWPDEYLRGSSANCRLAA